MFSFAIVMGPVNSYANVSAGNSEIDISLSPTDVLFEVSNMKPGDWAPRELTIKNNGKQDFSYQMSISNEGDEKLFNELLLEITDKDSFIYDGKLVEFDVLPKRLLEATESEKLTITLRFPEHLGNEFQGLSTSFKLTFVAEGSENSINPEDPKNGDKNPVANDEVDGVINTGDDHTGGKQLPNTASNMFNYLVIGACLLIAGILISLNSKRKRKARISKV